MPFPTARDAPWPAGKVGLLLVDMQRIWLEPGCNPHHRDWTEEHYFHRTIAQEIIPRQARLLKAARAAGIEVIHTIIQSLTEDGRDRSLDHKLSDLHVAPSDPNGWVVEALSPIPGEIVLPKTSSGVFNSTNIDYVLRNLDVEYLLIAGIMTDQCVDMAVRDAADRGYMVSCIADACAATSPERHAAAIKAFGGYCWITDTAQAEARLQKLAK
jgi:nicotinamidase-related amidase